MQGLVGKQLSMSARRDKRNGRWFFRKMIRLSDGRKVRISGVPTTCGLPDTKVGAEEAERLAITRVLQTGEVKPTPPPPEPKKEIPTIKEFAPLFMEISRLTNKASALVAKETALRLHIVPRLGDLRLHEVTYAVVADFSMAIAKAPRGLASRQVRDAPDIDKPLHPKTVNNILKVLHRMLVVARKRQLIATVPDFEWMRGPAPTFRFFTPDEVDKILWAAQPNWRPLIAFAARVGLRIGELVALRWEDVYLDSGLIVVRQSEYRRTLNPPKSGHAREVPITPETVELLRRLGERKPGPFVFSTAEGSMVCRHRADRELRRACLVAGLPPSGFHVLRHSFASNLVDEDVNMKAIQEMLGHSSLQMTERYAHLRKHKLRDAVTRLDRGLSWFGRPVAAAATNDSN
jgi:integrase